MTAKMPFMKLTGRNGVCENISFINGRLWITEQNKEFWMFEMVSSWESSKLCVVFAGGHRRRLPEGFAVSLRWEWLITVKLFYDAQQLWMMSHNAAARQSYRRWVYWLILSDFGLLLIELVWITNLSFWLMTLWTAVRICSFKYSIDFSGMEAII